MDANDDFYGKGLNELLLHAYNLRQKYPKPTIVVRGTREKKIAKIWKSTIGKQLTCIKTAISIYF